MSTYIRLLDSFPEHPKVVGLSDGAYRLYVNALCYCSRNLTDGNVPATAIKSMGGSPSRLRELCHAGLFDEDGDALTVHDYLGHQRSKAEVQRARDAAKTRQSRHRNGGVTPLPSNRGRGREILSPSSTARAALSAQYERTFGHEPTTAILDEFEHNVSMLHPNECIEWVLKEVGGVTPDKRSWRLARFKWGDCEKEGHGPRNGKGNQHLRAGGGGSNSQKPSQPSSRSRDPFAVT